MTERNDRAAEHDEATSPDDIVPVESATFVQEGASPAALLVQTEASESLRGLISYLVTNLVDDPDAVAIDVQQRGSLVQIQLRLPEEELGKVIGRGGRIAKAMRTALMIAGSRHHLRVSLDIES
ncbi:MAG: KH domain RNA binding protein YlqC [uncultured Thermomicrobiales bacterium]|uniref:RNA-binding protein KhpA n=1 Tax=uncultured Thermomicrobiales bacterium TaxID=1645740 RepID=A0A6J4UWL9_9BACT|nr:MAG: KH domain RNA binding protein YlqC [uncultured Thermomicrobiales bacterium]